MKSQNSLIKGKLEWLVTQLKNRDALPKNIELSKIGNMTIAAAYNKKNSDIVTESVFTGMDTNSDLATIKCLVEMIERKAYSEGFKNGHFACQTEQSDGFAAYPRVFSIFNNSKKLVRQNAYHEAIERYVWSTWWDNKEYTHSVKQITSLTPETQSLFDEINKYTPIEELYEITPHFVSDQPITVSIFFAFLKDGGVTSGGACGLNKNHLFTTQRAINELFRHNIGLYKAKIQNLKPKTFYEERLLYFGKDCGREIVEKRIFEQKLKQNPILLPNLKFDDPIPHSLDDIVLVHRCLLENQPPFVGGKLERLCL